MTLAAQRRVLFILCSLSMLAPSAAASIGSGNAGVLALAVESASACLAAALAILGWQMRRVREARRAADKANSAKTMFLANMSHEIRTPLNGIIAMAEMLGRSGLTADQCEMAGVILQSAESLMGIVNDILDYSKMEAASLRIESVAFELRPLLEGIIRLYEPHARQKGLALACRVSPDAPRAISGDPLRIRQVLLNLLSNAIKFTESGGVTLEVSGAGDPQQGPALHFRIVDTGIGIAPETSRTLFRAFTQAEAGTTRKFGGTGLGLAISLRMVTLMGGSIGLESQPGRGSVFWFVIPAPAVAGWKSEAERIPQVPAAAAPPPDSNPGRRVLIVEDNPVNQIVASRALRSLGCETHVVASGEAALQVLAHAEFDLIFMDCQMPGMDGYQTTAEIRRRESGGKRTPIVAMTANATEGNRERCAAAGMDDYVSKPFRLAALEGALQRSLPREISIAS